MKTLIVSILIVTAIVFVNGNATTISRPVPAWDYDKLEGLSSHVVIAVPIENRPATSDDELPEWDGDKSNVQGVVTKFHVNGVLKGNIVDQTISINHFENSETNNVFGNPPNFVDFSPYLIEIKDDRIPIKKQFVLFLNKTESGQFQFATGFVDPEFSVKTIDWFPN